MRAKLSVVIAGVGLLMAAVPAIAHHSSPRSTMPENP